jgi:hypothetical protein
MNHSDKITERNKKNAQAKFIDLTGRVFGRLTVIERIFRYPKRTEWKCKCICGVEKIIDGKHLKRGKILSCGCLCLEINSKRMKENNIGIKKHGLTNHPLRHIRKAMLHRCYNENNKFFKNYGGKGITVCEEWKNSLELFYEWAISSGWEKGLSIDRKNNEGNYNPENCEWITIAKNSSKNCVLGKIRKEKCARINITI